MFNIPQALLASFVTSIIVFVLGGGLYMNPIVDKIYKKFKDGKHPGVKQWSQMGKFMLSMYVLGMLLPSLLIAGVYTFIQPVLPVSFWGATLCFGTILTLIRIYPRLADMYLTSSYPNKLLAIEFMNGTLISFLMALCLTWLI